MLHILNLDTVGGVEELFVHFLRTAKTLTSEKQDVLVTSNKPHPLFAPYLTNADSIAGEKYLGPFKVPKPLRKLKSDLFIKRSAPNVAIIWNRMQKYPTSCPTIYYEHGASWISDKKTDFFQSVDQVFANSHAAKRVLELKWEVDLPITVIENPLKPTVQKVAKPKKAPRELQIGYIGRLIPLKGVSLILHACKDMPVKLVIAGDGPEREKLQQEAKRLNVAAQFCGIIEDVSSFYDSIDLLIVPSIREPLGLVAQEASLRGCPVIAANVDGLPEVVQHQKSGFLLTPTVPITNYPEFGGTLQNLPDLVYDPISDTLTSPKCIDPTAIKMAINHLLENPSLYEEMSQNAIAFASKRPNIIEYTTKLLRNRKFKTP